MKTLPYENATSGDKALSEIQFLLSKFGCTAFGTMVDTLKGTTMVQFRWREQNVSIETSWKGYYAAWLKAHPYTHRMRVVESDYKSRAMAQAKISVCSVLRDWIKGQITAVECGLIPFEGVFLSHVLLPDGRRLIDRVTSEILSLPSS
ncbi:MAG: hypothetical protein J0L73_28380 [Verrucomicrobia bacterium]|nr:hypothetical protein [Verrucomicrobiota bacterium]